MISKGSIIKLFKEYLHLFIICFVLSILALLIIMLMNIYGQLSEQRKELIELKNEYDSYVLMYKKIFDEYKMMKTGEVSISNQQVPEQELRNAFEVVNRDHRYLAESACNFGKDYNLEDSMRFLYGIDGTHYEPVQKTVQKTGRRPVARRGASSKRYAHAPMRSGDCTFQWPIARSQFWLSSRYGPRKRDDQWGFHRGVDLAALEGTPVQAAGRGVVAEVSYSKKGYGNTIVIAHAGDCTTRYAHLKSIAQNVQRGKRIESGECIGYVGATGLVRGKNGRKSASHLHFEIKEHGKHIDPLLMLT